MANFDIFLSHNSHDKPAVERIAVKLKRAGLEPWLDKWCLTPGGKWQEELAAGLRASSACGFFVGPNGVGDWASEELNVALDRAAKDRLFRLFLVLLPAVPEPFEPTSLPPFLSTRTWIDLRKGIEDTRGFQLLINAIKGVAPGPETPVEARTDICPYRGLQTFDEEHAEFFFGRSGDIQRLVEKLKATRFFAVLGPSGSGKSSVVRAGLIPRLRAGALPRSEAWTVCVFTPGSHPLTGLAAHLLRLFPQDTMQKTLDQMAADPRTLHLACSLALAERRSAELVLWVIDQFEEVFTLCRDEEERKQFLDNLLYAASVPDGQSMVVLTMRADFYTRCAAYPELSALVAAQQFLVSPMGVDGLRQAIEEPAWRVGLEFEEGLVATILDDVANEPGALPLLEHALLELWERRRGRLMTLEAYRETGGVQGALAKRADTIYDSFRIEQQEIVRRIMLRLTQPGEGTGDTRRRATLGELITNPGEADAVETVVRTLADGRLLTAGTDEQSGERLVDVSHEALIRSWPLLRRWIDEGRAALRLLRRVTEAAQEWQRSNQDEGVLYRGARLAQAVEWRERNEGDLNPLERQFLDASIALEQRLEQQEKQRQERELDSARKLAETERQRAEVERQRAEVEIKARRRQRYFIVGLVGLLLLAGVVAVVAVGQWISAREANTRTSHVASHSEYLRGCGLIASGDEDQALLSLAQAIELDNGNREAATRLVNLLGQRSWPHLVATLQHAYPVNFLEASSDGGRLFVATGLSTIDTIGTIHTWDLNRFQLLAMSDFYGFYPFTQLMINSTGDRLLAVRRHRADSNLELIDGVTGHSIENWDEPRLACSFSSAAKSVLHWQKGGTPELNVESATNGKSVFRINFPERGEQPDIIYADTVGDTICYLEGSGSLTKCSSSTSSSVQHLKLRDRSDLEVHGFRWAHLAPGGGSLFGLFTDEDGNLQLGRWELPNGKCSETWATTTKESEYTYSTGLFTQAGDLTLIGSPKEGGGVNSSVVVQLEIRKGDDSSVIKSELPFEVTRLLSQEYACAANEKTARIVPLAGGSFSGTMRHDGVITAICPLGKRGIATGARDGQVRIWNLLPPAFSPLQLSPPRSPAPAQGVRGQPANDEERIVDVSRDGSLELRVRDFGSPAVSIIQKASGKRIAAGFDSDEDTNNFLNDASIAPDGKTGEFVHFSHTSTGSTDFGAYVFSTENGRILSPRLDHSNCASATFTSDGKRLLTVGDGQIQIWDLQTMSADVKVLGQPAVQWAQVDRNGRIIVSLSTDGTGTVWDAKSLKPLRRIEAAGKFWDLGPDNNESSLKVRPAVSDDCRRLAAVSSGGRLVIWDLENGKPLSDPISCGAAIERLAFAENSSSEVRVNLSNGAVVTWRFADIPKAFSKLQVDALAALARYVAENQKLDKVQLPENLSDPNLDLLMNHFVKLSEPKVGAGFVGNNIKHSSDAVIKFWLKAASEDPPLHADGDLIQGLHQVARGSPEDVQALNRLRESWKRRALRIIELDLAGSALRIPGKYEDAGLSEHDAGEYLKAALACEVQNPILLSGLAYLGRLEVEKERASNLEPAEGFEKQKQSIADWKRQAEDGLAIIRQVDSTDPEQTWNRAQVLACFGKLEEAAKLAQTACNLDKAHGNYWVTQGVLLLALGQADAGSRALDTAAGLMRAEGDAAKLLKARFLIAQGQSDAGAQLSLAASDVQLDLPLSIWTCDWLASKGSLAEALDRLLKIHSSARKEEHKLAVDVRIAACFWSLGKKVPAMPYFQDLVGRGDLQGPLADMPPALLQAWQQGKMEVEKQQNQNAEVGNSASEQIKPPVNSQGTPTPARPAERDIAARIAETDAALNLAYARLGKHLGKAEQQALKMEELNWIKWKDGLPANSEKLLNAIQDRAQLLRKRLGPQTEQP